MLFNRPDAQKVPFPWGNLHSNIIMVLGPTRRSIPNCTSIGSAVFAQLTVESPYTLQWAAPFPIKIAPSCGQIWTQSNTWFLGATRVHIQNGIFIGSAVSAGFSSHDRDRPANRQTTLLRL